MNIILTSIADVKIIEPRVFYDERGFFMESWNKRALQGLGIEADFVQDCHSCSIKNTLRGLHYQTQQAQGKLIRVTRGEVFDVAVDMRANSPTYGQWVGEYLSETNKRMLWIPPGFAHGFLVISDEADFQYKCTHFYAPEFEQTINWNDPQLNIKWPLRSGESPLLSAKDQTGVSFLACKLP